VAVAAVEVAVIAVIADTADVAVAGSVGDDLEDPLLVEISAVEMEIVDTVDNADIDAVVAAVVDDGMKMQNQILVMTKAYPKAVVLVVVVGKMDLSGL
jgi:hypothetical protein